MKQVYDLEGSVRRDGGETILGLEALGTHACYMIFGVLDPGGAPRTLKAGQGHEEIVLAIGGSILVAGADGEFILQAGQAFYIVGEETWLATAQGPAEARYVVAGGHTPGQEHSH